MLGIYALGLVFYVSRFPERFAPVGLFDYLGASHQLWHVCVAVAMWVWFSCNVDFFARRMEFKGEFCAVAAV